LPLLDELELVELPEAVITRGLQWY
jgi:hypothetical protein